MKKIDSALSLLVVLMVPFMMFGQSSLTGVVVDSLAKTPMVGANVFIVGTGLGCATDVDGQYKIMNVPFGKHTLRVSSIGYAPKEVKVTVSSATPIRLDFELSAMVIQGQEVVITAQMRGQVAAMNQQLTSNTIVNVVSAEKIQELPDANAAEAIGRLSGVSLVRNGGEASNVVLRGLSAKFTNITIDGVRIPPTSSQDRAVDLSIISQGSLSGIELMKALTPDKDADAIAGAVNLVTRKAPSTRQVKIEAKGNYNYLDKSANEYNFNAQFGQRFFDDVLGVQVTGNLEQTIRSQESTIRTFDPTISLNTDWQYLLYEPQYQNEIRKRKGGSILLDLNTPDNGSIRFNNVYNQTSRSILTNYREYAPSGPVNYYYHDQEVQLATYNSSLRGENYLMGFEVNWDLAFSETKVKTPYDYLMNFYETSSTVGGGSGMANVPAELWKGPTEAWIPYAFNNFQVANAYQATDGNSANYDRERTAFLDIARKYSIGDNLIGQLKIGGKYRSKTRSYSANQTLSGYYLGTIPIYTMLSDGSFVPKNFSGTRFDGLVGSNSAPLSRFLDAPPVDRNVFGNSRLYPLINRDALRLWRDLNINGYKVQNSDNKYAEYVRNDLIDGNDYWITERMTAGYLMNTLSWGTSVSLILGARIEIDNNDYSAKYTPLSLSGANLSPQGLFNIANANHRETDILPNAQLVLKPTDFINIRLAGYKSLARPDFSDRLPQYVARSSSTNTLVIGNPDLKNSVATNYDAQIQVFGTNIGLFSVSAFYKNIKDMHMSLNNYPIAPGKVQSVLDSLGVNWKAYTTSLLSGGANLTYPYNSTDPTRVWGFEVEHQADLRFLPSLLKNIVLNYNFTILRSESWVTNVKQISVPNPSPGRPPILQNFTYKSMQKLPDQPEFFANASLGYDYERFSFRVSYFYQGEYNRNFTTDQLKDVVVNSFSRWDISVKQGLTDYLSVVLNVNNLTNTQEGTSWMDRPIGVKLPDTSVRYGTTVDLGVRVDL
ncbi:MAG TPA: TonB-dependent receptor [Bacteroidota bacterium]|nr:TonB-dependent receptor [Bacteroidota bacterium]